MKRILFEMKGSESRQFDFKLVAFDVQRLVEFRFLSVARHDLTNRLILKLEPSSLDKEFLGTEAKWDRQILAWRHVGNAWVYQQDPLYEVFFKESYPYLINYITIHKVMTA